MKPDITLTESSPYVKPHNARTLTVFEFDGTDDLDGTLYPVVQVRGPKGKVMGTVNTTADELVSFAWQVIDAYGRLMSPPPGRNDMKEHAQDYEIETYDETSGEWVFARISGNFPSEAEAVGNWKETAVFTEGTRYRLVTHNNKITIIHDEFTAGDEPESLLENPVREAMTAVREAIGKCESVDNDHLQGLITEVYGLLSALEDFDG